MKYPVNSKCPCNSGKKYKRCCINVELCEVCETKKDGYGCSICGDIKEIFASYHLKIHSIHETLKIIKKKYGEDFKNLKKVINRYRYTKDYNKCYSCKETIDRVDMSTAINFLHDKRIFLCYLCEAEFNCPYIYLNY